jgi:chemotaxis protein MotB
MKIWMVILVSLLMFSSSCVTLKQYKELSSKNQTLEDAMAQMQSENRELKILQTENQSRIKVLEGQIADQEGLLVEEKRKYNLLEERYLRADELYRNLQKIQNELVSGSDVETRRLLADLQRNQQELLEKEDYLRKLEDSLNQKKVNLEALQQEFESQQIRLVELENVLNQKDSIMTALTSKVSEALYSFRDDELTVEMKNGLLYVSMEEKLLFQSGSFDVGVKGKDAISKLSKVLELNPDIQILIEGHTDNVPYNGATNLMIDNWDLSVKRATSIVRILVQNSEIDPSRLTAAGRSKYIPVDTNDTTEGKQKNRRIEIILGPNLDELYELITK